MFLCRIGRNFSHVNKLVLCFVFLPFFLRAHCVGNLVPGLINLINAHSRDSLSELSQTYVPIETFMFPMLWSIDFSSYAYSSIYPTTPLFRCCFWSLMCNFFRHLVCYFPLVSTRVLTTLLDPPLIIHFLRKHIRDTFQSQVEQMTVGFFGTLDSNCWVTVFGYKSV